MLLLGGQRLMCIIHPCFKVSLTQTKIESIHCKFLFIPRITVLFNGCTHTPGSYRP
eukprot:c53849_g1_i1 orf=1-165(-)